MLQTSSSYLDASPISSPTSGPATGVYALDLSAPEEVEASCINDMNQAAAWSCNMADSNSLAMNVAFSSSASSSSSSLNAFVFSTADQDNITYGVRTPVTNWSPLTPVVDLDDPRRGPAYYFTAYYDKLVVLDEGTFSPTHVNYKRDTHHMFGGWVRHEVVPAGEQPWFCYFNQTFIEVFIYVSDNSSASESSASAATSQPTGSAAVTSSPYSYASSVPLTGSTSFAVSPSTAPVSSAWTSTSASGSAAYPTGGARKRDDGDVDWHSLDDYPFVVKIEERRISGSPQGYCQKMQILDDGTAGQVADHTGQFIQFTLNETDPTYGSAASSGASNSGSTRRLLKRTSDNSCHCQWMSE